MTESREPRLENAAKAPYPPALRLDAATPCASDPETWFRGDSPRAVERAKEGCRRCPVLAECAEWVAEHPQRWGIYAGMTPGERKAERRRRNRQRKRAEGRAA